MKPGSMDFVVPDHAQKASRQLAAASLPENSTVWLPMLKFSFFYRLLFFLPLSHAHSSPSVTVCEGDYHSNDI